MAGLDLTRREVLGAVAFAAAGAFVVALVAAPQRERKQSTICSGNLKQMSLAMAQYTYDFDATLPRAWFGRDSGPSNATVNHKWMDALFPYAKNERVFVCPADISTRAYRFRDGQDYGSYLFNDAYFAAGDKFTPPGGQQAARIADFGAALIVCGGSGGFRFEWPNDKATPAFEEEHVGEIRLLHTYSQLPALKTLRIDGASIGYRAEQTLHPKTINGRTIYTGLTIESD